MIIEFIQVLFFFNNGVLPPHMASAILSFLIDVNIWITKLPNRFSVWFQKFFDVPKFTWICFLYLITKLLIKQNICHIRDTVDFPFTTVLEADIAILIKLIMEMFNIFKHFIYIFWFIALILFNSFCHIISKYSF